MARTRVTAFVGTRPELIKMEPVLRELKSRPEVDLQFVHTGQHYDYNMSAIFIKELDLPEPDLYLGVKTNLPGEQIAKIVARSEKVMRERRPNIVIVLGDTNSALGAAIAAAKNGVAVGHVEAGCRSFEREMPEEQNRVLIADIASHNFAPTQNCYGNLLREGLGKDSVYLTGHPIVDLLKRLSGRLNGTLIGKWGLSPRKYYLVTVHRQDNVETVEKLRSILEAVGELSECSKVIFPVHPRTLKVMRKHHFSRLLKNTIVTEPLGYIESLALIRNASVILTDSGGIQQEAAILGSPCVTLRERTEWVETVEAGVNFLAGHDAERIITTVKRLEGYIDGRQSWGRTAQDLFGKFPVAPRIADIIESV